MTDLIFMHFIINSFRISIFILTLLVIKKIFNKHITARWHSNIGNFYLVMLTMPFIPKQFFNFGSLYDWIFHKVNIHKLEETLSSNNGGSKLYNAVWTQDFTVSVNRFIPQTLILFLIIIWLTGVFIFTVTIIICNYKLKFIKKSVQLPKNSEIEKIFEKCKNDLGITKNIILGETNKIQMPMTTGIFKPYVILPNQITGQLSGNEIKYIFLHELSHYKSKDVLINYIMCIFQIIYWFNPLIWTVFKQMRTEREIACDISVLKRLDKSDYINYGKTIINFIEKLSYPSYLSVTTNMSGSKQQIKKRIEKIAEFTTESKKLKIKSICIFMVVSCFVLSQVPNISGTYYNSNKYDFQEKQIVYEDLSSYFSGFEGSFVLYDLQNDRYIIYNKDKSITRVSPDSTYKIFDALIGLESGIINNKNSAIKWSGKNYPYESWNKDQDLGSAVKNSVNWYFQDIDKQIGREKLQSYYKKMAYGNYNLTGRVSDYWLESSLRISPLEQVQVLKDFYTNNMVFKKENINTVKNALKLSEKNGAVLSGKTGTGAVNGKNINGWFIGYVEKGGKTFIFAANIQNEDGAKGSIAANITLSILKDRDIY